MRAICFLLLLVWPLAAVAGTGKAAVIEDAVRGHVMPGFDRLSKASAALNEAARQSCDPEDEALRAAYGRAFDAWVTVSHLRFGPVETDNRGYALAFWPDPRGKTVKALRRLILDADPVIVTAEGFTDVSVAARGFYAMEYLLYDDGFRGIGTAKYRCALIRRLASDAARTAAAIDRDWDDHAALMLAPSKDGYYRSGDEALRVLYNALTTGLQFTSDVRLGRPLGTFERPRPRRAEARRSGRSLGHVILVLRAERDLAARLAGGDAALAAALGTAFGKAIARAEAVEDPAFASVAQPGARFRIEALQQSVEDIREVVEKRLGPKLGVSAGFNAMDGD